MNQPHQGMVIANLLEILCPALNSRDRDDCIRISWVRTEHISGNGHLPQRVWMIKSESLAFMLDVRRTLLAERSRWTIGGECSCK